MKIRNQKNDEKYCRKERKNNKKLFTKVKSNNIINESYKPLSKDDETFYEREGLYVNGTKDVVLDEVLKKLIISKEDFKKYFNERKIITKTEYDKYLKCKNKSLENFPTFSRLSLK